MRCVGVFDGVKGQIGGGSKVIEPSYGVVPRGGGGAGGGGDHVCVLTAV